MYIPLTVLDNKTAEKRVMSQAQLIIASKQLLERLTRTATKANSDGTT